MPRRIRNNEELSPYGVKILPRLVEKAQNFIQGKTSLRSFKKFANTLSDIDSDYGYYDYTLQERLCDLISDASDKENLSIETFGKFIELSMVLSDDLLQDLIEKKPDLVAQLDHRYFLNLAVELKSALTFNTLIEHGFNPQKIQGTDTPSPLALAAHNQGVDYLQSYTEKLGEDVARDLILERDQTGKDALSYAVEGRSYSKTVRFLLDNGADVGHRFQENLTTAISGKHNETLTILLTRNPQGISPEQALELSNLARECGNNLAHIILLERTIPDSPAHKAIQANISKSEIYERDALHKICQEGNLAHLEYLLSKINFHSSQLRNFNDDGKTPLMCAIEGNCYSNVVQKLLDLGADPEVLVDMKSNSSANANFRNNYGDTGIDAITLCVVRKEPETLGVILRHSASRNISDNTLNCSVRELVKLGNLNAVVVNSFFANIRPEDLRRIGNFYQERLLGTGMQYAPEATARKVRETFPDLTTSKIHRLFSASIENSSIDVFRNILDNFSTAELTESPRTTTQNLRNSGKSTDEERTRLLGSTTANPLRYGSDRSVELANISDISACDALFALALNKRKSDLDKGIESPSKEILILLLQKGFEPSNRIKMAADLASVGITEEDCRPAPSPRSIESMCSRLCETVSKALGFS